MCNVSHNAPLATIHGADEIVQRVRLLAQPGSPIVITALDVTDTKLAVGPGSYERTGGFTIEVMNVSARPVLDIGV